MRGCNKELMTLSDLLAESGRVRKTPETPPRFSVADVMKFAIGNVPRSQLSTTYQRMCKKFDLETPETYRFGGRPSPVCSAEQAEMLLQLLPGTRAAKFRATGCPQQREPQVEHLYVMRYSYDETAVKIGRSNNVERRRRELEASQNFRVEILAIFPAKGDLEPKVHERLAHCRSTAGAGKEWFKIPVGDGVLVVNKLIQELEAGAAE